MKIAVPTRNSHVDDHFGHCESYTIYTTNEEKKIVAEEAFDAPVGCGCKSNIASTLKEMGVTLLLAGNMGQGAVNKITEAGIKVVRGCSGETKKVTEAYLNDKLFDSGLTCAHTNGHNCH